MAQSIDDLLNNIFSNGRFTYGKKSEDSPSPFTETNKIDTSKILSSSDLKKQTDDLDKLNSAIMADIEEMSRQIDADNSSIAEELGTKTEKKDLPKATSFQEPDPKTAAAAFDDLLPKMNKEIIGQDDFLKKLLLAFKRPYVMGTEDGKAKNTILVQGAPGTGRHSAVTLLTKLLAENKVFPNENVVVMDLALYPTPSEQKLFLQDLYVRLQSGAPVLLFEHIDQAHTTYLQSLTTLVTTGSLPLSSRYVMQKGILVEAGTALTSENVSELHLSGQILVFVTELSESKVAGVFGSSFIDALGDVAKTGRFVTNDLITIARREMDALKAKSLKQLDFTINYQEVDQDLPRYFAGYFSDEEGVRGILHETAKAYKALAQLRLSQLDTKPLTITLSISDNALFYTDGTSKVQPLYTLLPESYKGELEEVRKEMENLVGLTTVKDYVLSLEKNLQVQQMRKKEGMKITTPSMHMIFTGNPGTGKTTIARIVGKYLKAIGALSSGHLVEVTRADLVGRYVGHTAPLTTQVVKSALGGVLFIDEAYSLYREQNDSFGLEAIDTLVKCIEDYRDELVVILAGYTKEMQVFLSANSGLASRFPNIIEFPDYTGEELLQITKSIAKGKQYRIAPEAEPALHTYFDTIQELNAKEAGNGRLARNKVEEAILNQSKRILAEGVGDLDLLIAADFDLTLPENV